MYGSRDKCFFFFGILCSLKAGRRFSLFFFPSTIIRLFLRSSSVSSAGPLCPYFASLPFALDDPHVDPFDKYSILSFLTAAFRAACLIINKFQHPPLLGLVFLGFSVWPTFPPLLLHPLLLKKKCCFNLGVRRGEKTGHRKEREPAKLIKPNVIWSRITWLCVFVGHVFFSFLLLQNQ